MISRRKTLVRIPYTKFYRIRHASIFASAVICLCLSLFLFHFRQLCICQNFKRCAKTDRWNASNKSCTIPVMFICSRKTTIMFLSWQAGWKVSEKGRKTCNRPFARSGHKVRNKRHCDANYAVGLPKQRNLYQSSPTLLCFESPTA